MTGARLGPALSGLAIIAAALALRCWHIAAWPLWLDESWSRWMTEQSWAGLWNAAAGYDTHPPSYYALLKVWTQIAPSSPFWLRMPSLAASLAMLPLAWTCAGRIETLRRSTLARGAAVAMAALSPPLIVAAGQARPYALFALAFGFALWAGLKLLRRASAENAGWRWWLLYLFGLEATLWLHSLGALFAAALGGGLLLGMAAAGSLRRDWLKWVGVHFLAGLLWLPAFLVLLQQRRNWSASSWLGFSWAEVPMGLSTGLAAGALGLILFLLAYFGARALLRDPADRPAALLLLSTALLPAALTILVSAFVTPIFLPRILVPSVLPLLLLAASAFTLVTARQAPALAGLVAALLAVPSIGHAGSQPEEKWPILAVWLDQRVGPREELWLLPNEIVLPFRYAAGDTRYAVRGLPAEFPAPTHPGPRPSGTRAVLAMTDVDARRLVADARGRGLSGIWVVTRFPGLFDPQATLPAAFGPERRDARDVRFAPLIVEHYRL